MRLKTIYSSIAAGVLAAMMAGCSPSEEIPVGGLLSNEAVSFTAAIETASNSRAAGPATRTTAGGDEWAQGDMVGIFMLAAGGEITTAADVLAENAPYTVADPATGALAPDGNDMYYPMEGSVDFAAYYPYNAQADGTLAIDMIDQSDPAALDVLWARTDGVSKSSAAVNLAFEHVLSKITFNITLGDGLEELTGDDATAVSLIGMPGSVTIDLSGGTLTRGAADEFTALKTETSVGADATFSAIVIPQEAGTVVRKALFTVDGEAYTWNISDEEAFAAGDHYVYPVTVQKTGVTVGAPTIAAWERNNHDTTTPQVIIAEGPTGDLSWMLLDDGTLIISGEGDMPDYAHGTTPWFGYADEIKTAIFESGVTSIGNYAIEGCVNLTSVTIPEGVTSIGHNVFEMCNNLASITIPESVTSIGDEAFTFLNGLISVIVLATFPPELGAANFTHDGDTLYVPAESLEDYKNYDWALNFTTILDLDGNLASGTTGLLSWGLRPDGTLTISGEGAMPDYDIRNNTVPPWNDYDEVIKTIVIKSGVKNIGADAFFSFTNLTSVTILEGVESIGNYAFAGCKNLLSITIPESVKSIGIQVFESCVALKSVTIPKDLEGIRRGVFWDCTNLTSITIPERVKSIEYVAFHLCNNLKSVTVLAAEPPLLEDLNFTIDDDTLYVPVASLEKYRNSPWADAFTTITAVEGIIAEGTVGTLTWILTGDGTLTISGEGRMPDYGINHTTPWTSPDVKKVVIGDGVESIGDYAFFRCPNLAEINIPASVTDISTGETTAFLQCNALSTLTVAADNPNYALGPRGELMSKDLKTLYLVPKNITGGYELVADNVAVFAFQGCTTLSLTVAESHPTYAHGPRGELMGKDWNGNKLRWVPESIKGDYLVPDGTVIITYGATYGLGATHLFIPASVARIEEYTFCSVDNLTDITLMGEWPPQLSGGLGMCFWGTDKGNITLHVPAGKKSAYEDAGYTGFREILEDS